MSARAPLVLTWDVGTTGTKTCLYRAGETFSLVDSALGTYELTLIPGGGAEQDPLDWYRAMVDTTREVLERTGTDPKEIAGLSFCAQMQGLVLADREGNPVRPAMSYMDQRAGALKEACGGGIRVAGLPLSRLLPSLRITGLAPASVKDPVWKYLWVRENEPEVFARAAWWLDVKDFLIFRLTGRPVMTRDSACATGFFDNRPGKNRWSRRLCRLYGVNPAHLPEIIRSTDVAGGLLPGPAGEMGLLPGTPVFGGGGDASLIGLGAGAVRTGDAHIYMGTSGWVSAVTDRRLLDLNRMIASITCALPGRYHFFCEQETSGKCLEWVRDHLALDEIGVYLEKRHVAEDPESVYRNLFEYLSEVISQTEEGCGGVLFAPWLHGSRSPFEDPLARGIFFNIGLATGKRTLIRAVVEGLAYNTLWMLESVEKSVPAGKTLRFVGGGALSEVTSGILADITGRTLEVPENPQNAGALGAALTVAVGLGLAEGFDQAAARIPVCRVHRPREPRPEVYQRNYRVFRSLYSKNRALFARLNGSAGAVGVRESAGAAGAGKSGAGY